MPTKADLRATLLALELEAPHTGSTLAGLDRLLHRRMIRRRTVAVGVVVAITVGSLAAPGLFRHQVSPSLPGDSPWAYRFAVDQLPGTTVRYHTIDRTYESATLYADGESYEVSVFHPRTYKPVITPSTSRIDVHGKPGLYLPGMWTPSLAWEYAPNAWASVVYTGAFDRAPADLRDRLVRVTEVVHTDRTTQMTLPFRVASVPGGLRADLPVRNAYSMERTVLVEVRWRSAGQGNRSLRIAALGMSAREHPVGEPVPSGDAIIINLGQFAVSVSAGGNDAARFSTEDLTAIARSITAAGDLDDPSTWIPVSEAIPIR